MDAAIAIEMHIEIAETMNDSKDFDVKLFHGALDMLGKVTLEDHFATPATLGDSQVFGAHVWSELGPRLIDFQDKRLRLMDASGVELMIVSLNAPAVQAIHDVAQAVATARAANDLLAEEVRKRPDRFAGLAALPMQDPEAAANELERCVRDFGFKGDRKSVV